MPKKRNHSASVARKQNLKVAREEKARKRMDELRELLPILYNIYIPKLSTQDPDFR
jgi:hypothetical protein